LIGLIHSVPFMATLLRKLDKRIKSPSKELKKG